MLLRTPNSAPQHGLAYLRMSCCSFGATEASDLLEAMQSFPGRDTFTFHSPSDADTSEQLRQYPPTCDHPQIPGCVVLPFFESGHDLSDEAFLADTQKLSELALPARQYTVERQSNNRKAIVSSSKPPVLLKAAAGEVPVIKWAQQHHGCLCGQVTNVTHDTALVLRVDSTPHGLKIRLGAALGKDRPVAQDVTFCIRVSEHVYVVDAQNNGWRSQFVAVEHAMPSRYVKRMQMTSVCVSRSWQR